MTEQQEHPYIERIAREARRPVALDPTGTSGARTRLLAAVRAAPKPRRETGVWQRFVRPRTVTISAAQGMALAASLVGIGVLSVALLSHRDGPRVEQLPVVAANPTPLPVSDTVVRFVFVEPQAARVSVVGDFNGWNAAATPMRRQGGVWSVTLPLSAGRHLYSYLVNGSEWIADPQAPLAPDDGFGHANSVVLVKRGSTL